MGGQLGKQELPSLLDAETEAQTHLLCLVQTSQLITRRASIKPCLQGMANHIPAHLIFPATEGIGIALPHFTDVKMEAEGSYITCTRSHSY